jgi:transposase
MGAEMSQHDKIFRLSRMGFRYDQNAKEHHISNSTIANALQGVDQPTQGKPGPASKVTPEVRQFIETQRLLDARLSDNQIARLLFNHTGVKINRTTVCRVSRDLGFSWRPPMTRQDLTAEQIGLRLQFAEELLAAGIDFQRVLFTDESRFALEPDRSWIHMRRGEWNETCFRDKTKYPTSLMIWGGIGYDYATGAIECSNSEDSEEYIEIIQKSRIINDLNEKWGIGQWFMMQDGAPCHTSNRTLAQLQEQMLILPGWPPNSCDLNPIEVLWAIIKRRIQAVGAVSADEFRRIVLDTWKSVSQETVNGLAMDFERRLRLVVLVQGRSISQYISSHKFTPHAEDMVPIPTYSPWTELDDDCLWEMNSKHTNQWTRISKNLNELTNKGRTPNEVKQRFRVLEMREQNRAFRLNAQVWMRNLEKVRETCAKLFAGEEIEKDSADNSDYAI